MSDEQVSPQAGDVRQGMSLNMAITKNQEAHARGGNWRLLKQTDGSMGYVNLDKVAMVLHSPAGNAVIVWAQPRPKLTPDGAEVREHHVGAAGMTPEEFLGTDTAFQM